MLNFVLFFLIKNFTSLILVINDYGNDLCGRECFLFLDPHPVQVIS